MRFSDASTFAVWIVHGARSNGESGVTKNPIEGGLSVTEPAPAEIVKSPGRTAQVDSSAAVAANAAEAADIATSGGASRIISCSIRVMTIVSFRYCASFSNAHRPNIERTDGGARNTADRIRCFGE